MGVKDTMKGALYHEIARMKWNIISHNIRGLNDPENILKERQFLSSIAQRIDIVMIQDHKLRGGKLEHLGSLLMPGYASWILEAAPGERSWLNPNATGKGGVGIMLAQKYARLVTDHGALYNDKVVWIKLEGVEGGNIDIACVYAPNTPTERRHLWHIMADSLPKDCDWIVGGDFNMTERPQDQSRDCGRAISDLEKFTWNGLLSAFQIQDTFIHQGGPRFSWNNGQAGQTRRLARLDRFYTPTHSRVRIYQTAYYIHGHSVGSDHSPVQLELSIGSKEVMKSIFKWNVAHLQGEMIDMLRDKWNGCSEGASFFYKLMQITRIYRFVSKQKAKEFKKEELDTRASLEVATALLHEDVYNEDKQGKVNQLRNKLDEIETRLARGAAIRARAKWQKVGDKCTAEFFKSVRQKNSQSVILELRDQHGRSFMRAEDLSKICFDFYGELYRHKEVSEEACREVFEGFMVTFTESMNENLAKEITVEELGKAVLSMAKRKAPGHDGIPMEFFQKLWQMVEQDFHQMVARGIEHGQLHEGVTKGLISLIPKDGDNKDLNHWRPITLLTSTYKIFAKTLQLRLQSMLRDIICPEQTTFLPLRFILDNIVLTQETLHWAKVFRQPTVFLKLDFSKAYDKVSWVFLFQAMQRMCISEDSASGLKCYSGAHPHRSTLMATQEITSKLKGGLDKDVL